MNALKAAAMAWVENVHHLYPVTFSDYFRIERSLRTQWIARLLPLREAA